MPDKEKDNEIGRNTRWDNIKKDAGNRTAYHDYDQERYKQKKALKELLDEYEFAIGDDKTFKAVLDDIRVNLDIDATAQNSKKYNTEKKNYKQIMTALNKLNNLAKEENGQLIAERDKFNKEINKEGANRKKLSQKENELIVKEESNENQLMISASLLNYYDGMTNGNLQIPDAPKTVRLTLHDGKVETTGEGKYNEPDTTYFIDATQVKPLGGFKDSAQGFDDDQRVEITDVDAKDDPLFPHEPSMNDIAQGSLGDCWFVNNIANIARLNPQYIRNMMKDNGDGTVTVRLYGKVPNSEYEKDHSKEEYALKPVYVKVDKKIPNEKGIFYTSVHSADNCLWVNMIERAAASIGLGTSTNIQILPPDYKERYEKLNEKAQAEKDISGDVYKNPWLFAKEGQADTFREFAPSYEFITGGYNRDAINMLMGPDNHSTMIETGKSQYATEINIKKTVDEMVTDPALITEMAFKESMLSHVEEKEDVKAPADKELGLLLSSSQTNAYDSAFKDYKDFVIDHSFIAVNDEKKKSAYVDILYVNKTCRITGSGFRPKNSLLDATDAAFAEKKKDEEFYSEMFGDEKELILKDTENKLVKLGNSTFDVDYIQYVMNKLSGELQKTIEEQMKKPDYKKDVNGRRDMILAAADAFKEKSFSLQKFENDDFPYGSYDNDEQIEKMPIDKQAVARKKRKFKDENSEEREGGLSSITKQELFNKYVDTFIEQAQNELVESLKKTAGIQKMAHDRYDHNIGQIFRTITKGVKNHVIMAAGVHHKNKKMTPEEEMTHLPDGHAYSIINAYEKNGQRYITLRNPWGDSSDNGIVYVDGKPRRGHVKDGVFDLKFEDFFGQVDDVSYDFNLDNMPDEPEIKADEAKAPDYLTSSVGHSFQRVLKDTYFDLLGTKKWPYSNTSTEFNEMMTQLKETIMAIPSCNEHSIKDGEICLQLKIAELKEKINIYREHCKDSLNDGRHPKRLDILKKMTDCIENSLTEDSVKDPREQGMMKAAEKMMASYYRMNKLNPDEARRLVDIKKLCASSTFKELIDDKKFSELDKISTKEAEKMMNEVLGHHKTAVAKENLGITAPGV